MECNSIKSARLAVYLPFTEEEEARFKAYLKHSNKKAGAWVATLVIRAMDEEAGRGDGSGQARELADYIANLSSEQFLTLARKCQEQGKAPPVEPERQGGAA